MSDPITTEVVRWSYNAMADEMSRVLARTAYSPIIYDMKDYSVGVFGPSGDLLGQAPGLPLFLGSLDHAVRVVVAAADPHPGDAYVVNDSSLVGSHLNDVTAVMPVYLDERLIGWTAAKAHWNDVGAKNPGFTADSTDIFQEGLRLGPVRVVAGGEWVADVMDILERNSRTPTTLRGDLGAQLAAIRSGADRMVALHRRYGSDVVEGATEDIFRQAAAATRAFVATIPDGDYAAEGFFDDDGHTDEAVPVRVRVQIDGSTMRIDLAGSSAQRQGSTNCGIAQTVSAARLALRYLMHDDSPVCGGSFECLELSVPERSIFAAAPPAACMFYGVPLGLMINLIFRALAPVLPSRVIAGQPDSSYNVLFTGPSEDGVFVTGEATALGWGAFDGGDGASASSDLMGGDLKNLPVESMELRHPVLVREYALRQDSGGAGRWRGGLGVVKAYEVLRDDVELSLWFERSKLPGWGLRGGRSGEPAAVTVWRGGERLELLKVNHLPLSRGDSIVARTGGGSGFGPPGERPPDAVADDVEDGYVSPEAAAREYRR